MKFNSFIRLFIVFLSLSLTVPLGAGVTPLQAGKALTIDCVNGNVLTKKGTTPTGLQAIAARVVLSLDSTGTVLTVNFQNIATTADAVLYALDLGLPNKFVAVNRMDASLSGFPAGARWLGPTDSSGPTNAIGTSTFAARETIAERMEDFLNKQKTLSVGFLQKGQGGTITVKFTPSAQAKNRPLLIDPVAYFLVSDPNAPGKRLQIASTGVVKAN